jgi:hypothetical protein
VNPTDSVPAWPWAARPALEERIAHLALEIAHLLRERRLLDAELARGGGEAAGAGDGDEVAKVPQFHRGFPDRY